jgi:hypothetical protein
VADADLEKPFFAAADRRLFSHSLTIAINMVKGACGSRVRGNSIFAVDRLIASQVDRV